MMRKALHGMDESAARLTRLTLRTLVWPPVIAVCGAAAVWMYRFRDQLPQVATNSLPYEDRVKAVAYFGVVLGAIMVLYFASILAVRLKTGAWRGVQTASYLNRALAFVIGTPFAVALLTPGIEHKSPKLALTYVAVAAAAAVPTFMLFAVPEDEEPARLQRWLDAAGRFATPAIVLGMFVAYGMFFTQLSITNHHAMVTRTMDLGVYDNIFYHSIHGRPLASSLMKTGSHVSGHFDPILVLLSPVYLLKSSAESLLALQSFWLAAGVFPAYLLGAERLRSRFAGVVMAAVYALHPAVHGANMYEFHSLTLLTMPLLWALHFLQSGRHKAYYATFVLLLLVREDVSLLMCFVGAYALLLHTPGATRAGWITIVGSLTYFALVKLFVMTSADVLNAGPDSYGFAYYYRDMIPDSKGMRGLVISLVTNPTFVLSHAFSEAKIDFLLKLFLPMALLPLFAKPGRVMLIYGLTFTLLASREPVYQTSFQYSMLLVPMMVSLIPVAIARLRDGRAPEILATPPAQLIAGALGALLVCSLLTSWKFGALVENKAFRGGFARIVRELQPDHLERIAKVREMAAMIEPGAGVTVTDKIGPHVSNRPHVFLYRQRKVKESHYVFVDENEIKGKWRQWHDRRVARDELQLLAEYKSIKLYRFFPENEGAEPKRKPKPQPPDPKPRLKGDRRVPPEPDDLIDDRLDVIDQEEPPP